MTQRELAEASGIAPGTISAIENNRSDYKINKATAEAICEALKQRVGEIFDGIELSHLGRPPKTGKSITKNETTRSGEVICQSCFLAVPIRPKCVECDSALPLAAGM